MSERRDHQPEFARSPHFRPALSRREFLTRAGAGFGSLALSFMLAQEAMAEAKAQAAKGKPSIPLAPKAPMFPTKAKSVIFLFMYGGPQPGGHVRPQARPGQISRQDDEHGPAQRRRGQDVRRRQPRAPDAQPLRVQKIRQVRHRGLRSVPACRRVRGRHLPLSARSTATATTMRPPCSR